MALPKKSKGAQKQPLRMILHAREKFGKSTYCLDIPDAAHLDVGRETLHLAVPERWECNTWDEIMGAADFLARGKHNHRAVILDTADGAQDLIWAQLKTANKSIFDDYGRGYRETLFHFHRLWELFEQMHEQRGMHIVIVVHSQVTTFEDPQGPKFDQYVLRLQDAKNSSVRQFLLDKADVIAFGNFTSVDVVGTKDRTEYGTRRLFLRKSKAYDSGCRFTMPPQIEFSWAALMEAWEGGSPTEAADMRAQILAMVDGNDKLTGAATKQLKIDGDDLVRLSRTRDRLAFALARKDA